MQEKQTTANSKAWNTKAYEAWTIHFGHPEAQAENLHPIFELVNNLLRNNGRLIFTDFHPFSSKSSNYFDSNLVEENIAFSGFLSEDDRNNLPKVLLRKWTMGEILSTLADKNMFLRRLDEEPHHINVGIPAFYTIVADKINEHQAPLTPQNGSVKYSLQLASVPRVACNHFY